MKKNVIERVDWDLRAREGYLASGIDPEDRRGHKNRYVDLLQKMALNEFLDLKGDEIVLDFGCGSGRMTYWIAPKVKKVIGLETTPGMIELAKGNRMSENIEFMLYDGIHFPLFPDPFDVILSVGVLQYMENEALKNTVSVLAKHLNNGGKFYLIEQASDNLKVGRPTLEDYLRTFKALHLRCSHHHAIRNGRWWLLYLIRYGLIPPKCFPRLALWELRKNRKKEGKIRYYKDYLFLLEKV
jgi:SAM-dependent methyltransferase